MHIKHLRGIKIALEICVVMLASVFAAYNLVYAGRILPRVYIGTVAVGGLTQNQASRRLAEQFDSFQGGSIRVIAGQRSDSINFDNIGTIFNPDEAAQRAWLTGRSGSWLQRLFERVQAPFAGIRIPALVAIDHTALEREIYLLAQIVDEPSKDIRLHIQGQSVEIFTDTKLGRVIDQPAMEEEIYRAITQLDPSAIEAPIRDDFPHIDPATAEPARQAALRMLSAPLKLLTDDQIFVISADQLGQWIVSSNDGNRLVPDVDRTAISAYVTGVAQRVNIEAKKPIFNIQNGRVISFVPPQYGQALEETRAVDAIMDALYQRRDSSAMPVNVTLSVKTTKASAVQSGFDGIVELIGKATTPFAGSPRNRIHNISNGIKFLSGFVIQPGEEFSTLNALGTIDNTTGYLPELVIKGDKTTPEFGGGLCQVSTTLFRAVMNAGLPVTARRNHSYRVGYYEHDAEGNFIGPGLDATIYEPDLDFKFKNDTAAPVLIFGYVIGDKATFELYGTKDGRTSHIEGPKILSEILSGDPIYIETDTLPKGKIQQIEIAHAGGSAVAYYSITYPDGHTDTQEFKSWYRRWPAQYLVGTSVQ